MTQHNIMLNTKKNPRKWCTILQLIQRIVYELQPFYYILQSLWEWNCHIHIHFLTILTVIQYFAHKSTLPFIVIMNEC